MPFLGLFTKRILLSGARQHRPHIMIDTIIAEKEAQRNNSFQTFMSIASIVVALLFGLPAVYDTFSITRKSLSFFSQDIPCLTVENTSLFAWIFVMAMLCVYMCRKYKKK